jgi:hypothetical protein
MMLAALALAAGCGQSGTGARELRSVSATPPAPVAEVHAVDFWAAPPAVVNWDDDPGPDGIQVRLFLYRVDRPEPVAGKGTVEFMMVPGMSRQGESEAPAPLRVWTFTPQELATRQVRGMVGWGYIIQLGWGRDVPTVPVVTFTARYTSPDGKAVVSAPITVPVPRQSRSGPSRTSLADNERLTALARLRDAVAAAAPPVAFRREVIDPDPPGAQHAIALAADFSGDGRTDVVIGCKRGEANLFWYENPTWKRHDIAAAPGLEAGGVVLDINGDGRPDIVAGQQQGGRELYWFECPADPTGPWKRRVIENRYTQYRGLAAGDVDGDGKPEVVSLAGPGGVLTYYDIPSNPSVEPWPADHAHVVAEGLKDAEGLAIADVDGDARTDILAGLCIYRRSDKGEWAAEAVAEGYEKSRVAVADLDGDGRPEIILSEGDKTPGRLAWLSPPSWSPHPLREDLFHPRSLAVADFNGDGRPDVFVGEMGLGRNASPRLIVYVNEGRGRFREQIVSTGVPTHEAKVADLNGDGRPDIVGKPYEPERHVDVWFNVPPDEATGTEAKAVKPGDAASQ